MKLLQEFLLSRIIGVTLLLASVLPGSAATITWTNTSGGNWNALANWSPNQVPGTSDDAYITNNGTYTVTLNANAPLASLTLGGTSGTQSLVANANEILLNGASTVGINGSFNLGGATLSGAGTFTINGQFNWSGGTINNTGGVLLNGASSLTGAGNDTMVLNSGGVLINAGQLTWGGSGQNFGFNSGIFTNLASGTVTITNDVSTFGQFQSTIANAGFLTKTGTTGISTLGENFINTGTVTVQSGTLSLTGGGTQSGIITYASGATLNFGGGTHFLVVGYSGTGPGSVTVSAGAVNYNNPAATTLANLIVNGGAVAFNSAAGTVVSNLTITGGALGGSGPVAVNGPFNWSLGTINSTAGVTLNGASSLTGAGNDTMVLNSGGVLLNAGQLTWGGSGQNFGFNSGNFTNLASGTILITNDVSTFGAFQSTIVNAGVLTKTGITGITTLGVPLLNTGTLAVQSGTVALTIGGTLSGLFANSNGATLNFSGGLYTAVAGFSATGAGTLLFSGGTLNFNSVPAGTVSNLTMTGGTLGGTGFLTVGGAFNWSGGSIVNSGGVTLNGTSLLSGVGQNAMYLTSGVLINAGQLTWGGSGNNFGLQFAGFTNLPSGTITITNDVSTYNGLGSTILNAGVFTKTGTTGTTTLGAGFINTGTLAVQSGTINLTGGYSLNSGTLSFGITSATNFGQLTLPNKLAVGGILTATANGYVPSPGDSIPLITYTGESGIFSTFNLPRPADWLVNYGKNAFTLNVESLAPPYVTLEVFTPLPVTNGFTLLMLGPVGSNYVIQASTDLNTWAPITNFVPTNSSLYLTDTAATNFPSHRFYRAVIH